MRKKEFSKRQLSDRKQVIDVLEKAGWKGTAFNRRFEEGDWLEDEASMEYSNGKMDLTANYTGSSNSLTLRLADSASSREVAIKTEFGDRLEAVLKTIVSFQKKISAANYRDYFSEIVRLVENTYADRGDQGWQKLVVDDPEGGAKAKKK